LGKQVFPLKGCTICYFFSKKSKEHSNWKQQLETAIGSSNWKQQLETNNKQLLPGYGTRRTPAAQQPLSELVGWKPSPRFEALA